MTDWTKWTSTNKYFEDVGKLQEYCRKNNIKEYDYSFTFAYGYQLLLRKQLPK